MRGVGRGVVRDVVCGLVCGVWIGVWCVVWGWPCTSGFDEMTIPVNVETTYAHRVPEVMTVTIAKICSPDEFLLISVKGGSIASPISAFIAQKREAVYTVVVGAQKTSSAMSTGQRRECKLES